MVPTRDHNLIMDWAEDHNAAPAQVHIRKHNGEPARITFLFGEDNPGTADIQPISWETFFALFDMLGLSLVFDALSPRYELVRASSVQPSSADLH